MNRPVKILFYFAVFKRLKVLEIFLQGLERLKNYNPEKFIIIPFAVCSNDDERALLTEYNVSTVKYCNTPIGKKKNIGLSEALKNFEFDYLFESGSDDLYLNKLLDLYYDNFFFKKDCFGLTSCYHLKLSTLENTWFDIDYTIGAGRCISSDCLEKFGQRYTIQMNESTVINYDTFGKGRILEIPIKAWNQFKHVAKVININYDYKLWNDNTNIGLDAISEFSLNKAGYQIERIKTHEPFILDLKTDENIHCFKEFKHSNFSTKQLLQYFHNEKNLIEKYGSGHIR